MNRFIKIVSILIILLGITHISFAFPLQPNTDTLWFVGAGMAIVFSGFINFIAINGGGSSLSKSLALTTNGLNVAMFCYAIPILNEPQIYIAIALFLLAFTGFILELFRNLQSGKRSN